MFKKWFFILSLAALFMACESSSGDGNAGDGYDRSALLSSVADRLVLPAYTDLLSDLNELKTAQATFNNEVSQSNLDALRLQFEEAYKSWQYVELYRLNPENNYSYKERMNSYPASTVSNPGENGVPTIDASIASGEYNLGLSNTYHIQGFPALDYLLYGIGTDDAAILQQYGNTAYLDYLEAVVTRMFDLTEAVKNEWEGSYKDAFVADAGSSATASTDRLVNSYIYHFERDLRERIKKPGNIDGGGSPLFPKKVEAYYHGTLARSLFDESLKASEYFFLGKNKNGEDGTGLDDYLTYLEKETLTDDILDFYVDTHNLFNSSSDTFVSIAEAGNASYFNDLFNSFKGGLNYIEGEMLSAMNISPEDQGIVDGD